ncbi:hypothetical protein ACFO3I_15605 [Rheinheimera marina]|uniref:Uncharacterized protein n=1 Tax=Rheinheimera marina TaxID=1774958 RepID=A0ABV9JQB2_9GAMM
MPTFSFCLMRLLLLSMLLSLPLCAQQWLETESYWIRLDAQCATIQGCDDIQYQGHSKTTGATLALQGRSWWVGNKTAPLWWGYRFYNGRLYYLLHRNGLLQVTNRKGHVLVEEQGQWLQQAPYLPIQTLPLGNK